MIIIITCMHDINDVCMCSVECETNHSLVQRFKLCVHKKNHIPGVKIPEHLNVKLKEKDVCTDLTE